MLQLAQDVFKVVQDRVRTTLNVAADLAESMGAPPLVTSVIQGIERMVSTEDSGDGFGAQQHDSWAPPTAQPAAPAAAARDAGAAEDGAEDVPPKRRGTEAPKDVSEMVRPLGVDDSINGSTYLARIIWSLGVAKLEGTGPLRPADMARMIMSRSPVSLEPPNVARYIRRSKPTCIEVDHVEGNSSFYTLNDEGQALFEDKYLEN